jgi:hypothetical protein
VTLVPELRREIHDAASRQASRGIPGRLDQSRQRRGGTLRARGGLAFGGAVIAVVAVLLISATSSTSPAYALTAHGDGSYTLRIYTLSHDIPQLNAKLASLGIDETVVPIVDGCHTTVPNSPISGQTTIILRPNHYDLAPGDQGFVAARVLPNGQAQYAQGAMAAGTIPACFGTQNVTVVPASDATTTQANPGQTTSSP